MKTKVFWIFGILQSLSLAALVFVIFNSMNTIYNDKVIGLDSQIVLSLAFPVFLLIVEYIIYKK